MKVFAVRFLVLLVLVVNGFRSSAQVLPQDSLALVALYNNTAGAQWFDHANWLSTRVGLWEGVAIVGNRVQTLSLGNNNLNGTIPNAFCDLSGLEYIYLNNNSLSGLLPACIGNAIAINSIDLRNNQLTGAFPSAFATAMPDLADIWISNNFFTDFPDLRGVAELSNLHVDGNAFTFEDLIPNASIPNLGYVYAPQATVTESGADLVVNALNPFVLHTTIAGAGNTYQWQLNAQNLSDNARFSGTATSTLSNNAAESPDDGFYSVRVANPALPLLTITVVSLNVQVIDNRLAQSLDYPHDTLMYCGDNPLLLPGISAVSFPLAYDVLSAYGSINGAFEFSPRRPGIATVRVYNGGDATYRPLEDTLRISIFTHFPIPAFVIENDLPIYEGEELTLAVEDIPGVSYSWATPDLLNDETNAVTRPSAGSQQEGMYEVRIYENTCSYDTLQILVTLNKDSNIVIYELITPNGDGDNETFYIKNLESIPPIDVTVFNVWHQVVYSKAHYENDWDGGGLPVGTYYYLVRIQEWDKVYKGNLYIKR